MPRTPSPPPTTQDTPSLSSGSMDSFVREAPLPRDASTGDLGGYLSSVSPTSSRSDRPELPPQTQEPGDKPVTEPCGPSPEPRAAHIRANSDVGTIVSHTGSIPPPPAHDFFRNMGYEQDSDASAASLIYKTNPTDSSQASSAQESQTQRYSASFALPWTVHRSRRPSHDSTGSSSSLRLVSPRGRTQPPLTTTPTHNTIKPHLLPYSERRKLLQQRQEQRQRLALPSQQPGRHPASSHNYLAVGTGGSVPYPPLTNVSMSQSSPMGPPQSPSYPGTGLPPYPGSLPFQSPGYPPPPQPQGYPPPPMKHVTPLQQRHMVPRPPTRATSAPTPPLRASGSSEGVPLIDAAAKALLAEERFLTTAAPVTAPSPLPPILVRQESTGSVSSLGSLDRSGRESPIAGQDLLVDGDDGLQSFQYDTTHSRTRDRDLPSEPTGPRVTREAVPWQPQGAPRIEESPIGQLASESRHDHRRDPRRGVEPRYSMSRRTPESRRHMEPRLHSAPLQGSRRPPVHDEASDSSQRRPFMRNSRPHWWEKSDEASSSNISSSGLSSESESKHSRSWRQQNERTRLLPPSGVSTSELMDKSYADLDHSWRGESRRQSNHSRLSDKQYGQNRYDGKHQHARMLSGHREMDYRAKRTRDKRKKKKKRSRHRHYSSRHEAAISDSSLTSTESAAADQWMGERLRMLDIERARLLRQWKAEAQVEALASRESGSDNCCCGLAQCCDLRNRLLQLITWLEELIANLPISIGAIALAIANIGVDWFQFAVEHDPHCMLVHFHSASQCSFPEFPGCYYCDTVTPAHLFMATFRRGCLILAGCLASMYIAKTFLFHRIVLDELSSPTTAAPAGLICATLAVVFTGGGTLGRCVVAFSAGAHLLIAIWFIYMALAYRLLPEPSWFPNTVAIGISALKIWPYFPSAGHFLMAISLSLNFFFFPTSLIRVALDRKIKAPVAWMQMSAPNIALYTMTIMAQPSFPEEHPDVTSYQRIHRAVYLPCMHFLFGLVVVGLIASLASLMVRWRQFRKAPFTPAHSAFCNPALYHANSIQAYWAAVTSFSGLPSDHAYLTFLYAYWVFTLVLGTALTTIVAGRYLLCLSSWTRSGASESDPEPPAPHETTMAQSQLINTGDTLVQSFVSPAILQANETGQLTYCRDSTGGALYRRSRNVGALGFEPVMGKRELKIERELLNDFVCKNPPRRRHRTLSVPGIDFSYGTYTVTQANLTDLESSAFVPPASRDWDP